MKTHAAPSRRKLWDLSNPASPCHVLQGLTDEQIREFLRDADEQTLMNICADEVVAVPPCAHCGKSTCYAGAMCPARPGIVNDLGLRVWAMSLAEFLRQGEAMRDDPAYPWFVREALHVSTGRAQALIALAIARLSCPWCRGAGKIVSTLSGPRTPCVCSMPQGGAARRGSA